MSSWRDRLVETREAIERRTGYTVEKTERVEYLEEADSERRMIQRDLDMLGYSVLNYNWGRPQELTVAERRRLAQKSRVVWMKDPQAGAAVDLMNDFVFGRGLTKPKANDDEVQAVIDEAFSDPDNQLVLTSYAAQLALGTDLELQPLSPDTEIRMADGTVKQLKDVAARDTVVTHTGAPARVIENRDMGVQERLRLVTSDGRRVEGTATHPFLTVHRGWVALEDLEVADELVREPLVEGLMANLSADEARLLGYFVGDGSCSSGNATFTNADPEVIADFTATAERQGWRVTHAGYGPMGYGVAGGVRPWLRYHGLAGHKAYTKRVPEAVLRAPNHLVAEFLRGYFMSDGCASTSHPSGQVKMSTVSRGLADDVLHLLGRLGVKARIRLNDAPSRNGKHVWEVLIAVASHRTFADAVAPIYGDRGQRLDTIAQEWRPRKEIALAAVGVTPVFAQSITPHNLRWGTTVTARSESPHDRVVSVTPIGPGPVRCLAVDHEDHSYLANGLTTHNCNLFFLVFENGEDGKVKLGLLDHDTVETVVRDEDNRLRILYYLARHFVMKWDYQNDSPLISSATTGTQPLANAPTKADQAISQNQALAKQGTVKYYEHWRNVEDLLQEVEDGSRPKPQLAPDSKLGDGKVYHVAINKGMEMAFGHPRFDRLIRWFNSYNNFLDARVDIMAASAAFVMKRKVHGTPQQLQKMANQALSRRSQLGMSRDPFGGEAGPKAGGVITENESVDHEPFSINTNAAGAAQDAQMLRAMVSAATRWPASYLGDASQSNLATATCHDDQTEALTDEGWMGLPELKARDTAGTLPRIGAFDVAQERIVYQQPKGGLILQTYVGQMARLRKPWSFDALVTPDHRMLFKRGEGVTGALLPERAWETARAVELPATGRLWARTAAPMESRSRVQEFVLAAVPVAGKRAGMPRGTRAPIAERNARIRALAGTFPTPLPGECACGCGEATSIADRNRPGGQVKGQPVSRLFGHVHHGGRDRKIAELTGCTQRIVHEVLKGSATYRPDRSGRGFVMRSEQRIPMDAFLKWLGWYIAEGSDGQIAQSEDSPWLDELRADCAALGVEGRERFKQGRKNGVRSADDAATRYRHRAGYASLADERVWTWTPRNVGQWTAWLDVNVGVGAANKRVPAFVFDLPADQQMQVLRGLMGGDGACDAEGLWERRGSSTYGTTSSQLADDVQRLAMHCGFRATVRSLPSYDTTKGLRTPYYVNLVAAKSRRDGFDHAVMPRPVWEHYNGEVWCFSLPADTMVTRRNGTVLIARQSLELPVLVAVEGRQRVFEEIIRFFTDRVIERAVDSGRLDASLPGKPSKGPAKQPAPTNLEPGDVTEGYEDEGQDEQATQRDLGYEFSMPSPLKRMLGDVVTAVQVLAAAFDPTSSNTELKRTLLAVGLQELGLEDPAGAVERVFPPGYVDPTVSAGAGPPSTPPPGFSSDSNNFGEFSGMGGEPNNGYGGGYGSGNPYGAVNGAQAPEDVGEAHQDEGFQDRVRKRAQEVESMLDVYIDQALADVSRGNGNSSE